MQAQSGLVQRGQSVSDLNRMRFRDFIQARSSLQVKFMTKPSSFSTSMADPYQAQGSSFHAGAQTIEDPRQARGYHSKNQTQHFSGSQGGHRLSIERQSSLNGHQSMQTFKQEFANAKSHLITKTVVPLDQFNSSEDGGSQLTDEKSDGRYNLLGPNQISKENLLVVNMEARNSMKELVSDYVHHEGLVTSKDGAGKLQHILHGHQNLTETFLGPSKKVVQLKRRLKQAEKQRRQSIEKEKKYVLHGKKGAGASRSQHSGSSKSQKSVFTQPSIEGLSNEGSQERASKSTFSVQGQRPLQQRFRPSEKQNWETGSLYTRELKAKSKERMEVLKGMKKTSFNPPFSLVQNSKISEAQNDIINRSQSSRSPFDTHKKAKTSKAFYMYERAHQKKVDQNRLTSCSEKKRTISPKPRHPTDTKPKTLVSHLSKDHLPNPELKRHVVPCPDPISDNESQAMLTKNFVSYASSDRIDQGRLFQEQSGKRLQKANGGSITKQELQFASNPSSTPDQSPYFLVTNKLGFDKGLPQILAGGPLTKSPLSPLQEDQIKERSDYKGTTGQPSNKIHHSQTSGRTESSIHKHQLMEDIGAMQQYGDLAMADKLSRHGSQTMKPSQEKVKDEVVQNNSDINHLKSLGSESAEYHLEYKFDNKRNMQEGKSRDPITSMSRDLLSDQEREGKYDTLINVSQHGKSSLLESKETHSMQAMPEATPSLKVKFTKTKSGFQSPKMDGVTIMKEVGLNEEPLVNRSSEQRLKSGEQLVKSGKGAAESAQSQRSPLNKLDQINEQGSTQRLNKNAGLGVHSKILIADDEGTVHTLDRSQQLKHSEDQHSQLGGGSPGQAYENPMSKTIVPLARQDITTNEKRQRNSDLHISDSNTDQPQKNLTPVHKQLTELDPNQSKHAKNQLLKRSLGEGSIRTEFLSKVQLRNGQQELRESKQSSSLHEHSDGKHEADMNATLQDSTKPIGSGASDLGQELPVQYPIRGNTLRTQINQGVQKSCDSLDFKSKGCLVKPQAQQKQVSAFKLPVFKGVGDLLPALERDMLEPVPSFKNLSQLVKDKHKEQFYAKKAKKILARLEHKKRKSQQSRGPNQKPHRGKVHFVTPIEGEDLAPILNLELQDVRGSGSLGSLHSLGSARSSTKGTENSQRRVKEMAPVTNGRRKYNMTMRTRQANSSDLNGLFQSQAKGKTIVMTAPKQKGKSKSNSIQAILPSVDEHGNKKSKHQRKLEALIHLKYEITRKNEGSSLVYLNQDIDSAIGMSLDSDPRNIMHTEIGGYKGRDSQQRTQGSKLFNTGSRRQEGDSLESSLHQSIEVNSTNEHEPQSSRFGINTQSHNLIEHLQHHSSRTAMQLAGPSDDQPSLKMPDVNIKTTKMPQTSHIKIANGTNRRGRRMNQLILPARPLKKGLKSTQRSNQMTEYLDGPGRVQYELTIRNGRAVSVQKIYDPSIIPSAAPSKFSYSQISEYDHKMQTSFGAGAQATVDLRHTASTFSDKYLQQGALPPVSGAPSVILTQPANNNMPPTALTKTGTVTSGAMSNTNEGEFKPSMANSSMNLKAPLEKQPLEQGHRTSGRLNANRSSSVAQMPANRVAAANKFKDMYSIPLSQIPILVVGKEAQSTNKLQSYRQRQLLAGSSKRNAVAPSHILY